MDIFFSDPTDVPLPPEEVRIRQFSAEPWPDGRRVRIHLEITPFQKRPSSEIEIYDAGGEEIATLSIVEAISPSMDLTMHLRVPEPRGMYKVMASLYYYEPENDAQPMQNVRAGQPPKLPSRIVRVDQAETTFLVEG